MVAGTASSLVLLEHKGVERPGVRPAGEVGRSPVRESLGYHQKDFGPLFAGQWFSFLIGHQSFLENFQKKYGCLLPSSPI